MHPSPSGEPETFPEAAALAAKFDALAGPVLNAGSAAPRARLAPLPDAPSVRRHFARSARPVIQEAT